MPKSRNHYDTLKVSLDAPGEVIQAAYRSLARKYHPDRAGTSAEGEAAMKAINAAYEVLGNPVDRARYDEWLATRSATSQTSYPRSDDASDQRTDEAAASQSASSDDKRLPATTILLALCYVAAAVLLLRFPGPPRIVGFTMLVTGWGILQLRRRKRPDR